MSLAEIVNKVDEFVWGPVMLLLLVGTGVVLTFRTRFMSWRNLGYAIKSTLSKEARQKSGEGDVSPFAALTTALAATIGTGNIVGVATAMVSGGPGALVWMWISACFGLTSKFSECMLAIKYREVNGKGEMSGGPMYTMKKGIKNKKFGACLGFMFAFFTVVASFGIGNMTQGNSIASALKTTFNVPMIVTGVAIMILIFVIVIGGINSISKVSSVVVPLMAVFYVICGLIVIVLHIENVPSGVVLIVSMAFSTKAVTGGIIGTIVASMMNGMRFGVARGVFSNEAGMGSAAITAACATTDNPVKQAYINMTGTFWDTIVVCTITGLAIASSGVLGKMTTSKEASFEETGDIISVYYEDGDEMVTDTYTYTVVSEREAEFIDNGDEAPSYYGYDMNYVTVELKDADGNVVVLTPYDSEEDEVDLLENEYCEPFASTDLIAGTWKGDDKSVYTFKYDPLTNRNGGSFYKEDLIIGAPLTIEAFKSALGKVGGWFVAIGIALFAFSTILGWEYHGEKAVEYLVGSHKFNMVYRIFFSFVAIIGCTQSLDMVWSFSDIANALMAVPNLICMLIMSKEIANDMKEFQPIIKEKKAAKKAKKA